MKTKKFSLINVLFNCIVGMVFSAIVGINPLYGMIGVNALGASVNFFPNENVATGSFYAGLFKEVWIDALLDNFYPASSFMARVKDLTEFVEYDKINLAEVGADPDVLINNSTYPIDIADRTDNPLELVLDTYDTKNTRVRSAEAIELNYNKVLSVTNQHQKALQNKQAQKALHAYAPASHAVKTPVLVASGGDNGLGFKRLKIADIIALKKAFDDQDFPAEGRVLVLTPQHMADLLIEDKDLFKSYANTAVGTIPVIYGFEVFSSTLVPRFNKTTGVKVAFAAAAANTDVLASVAFIGSEVMKCQGTYDMFHKPKEINPEERADIIGFQGRYLALPLRAACVAAIYSPVV